MSDLTPRQPQRPLWWPDIVSDLGDVLDGVQDEIYIVGGAVRDAYLHRPLKDIDMATSGEGMRLARKIANHYKGDFFPLDTERDVGRAIIDTPEGRLMFDVARFRGLDLLADLRDRDFTLNAMAVDLHTDLSQLIDPLDGEQDILAKRLRRCSPTALQNDPIRALRAIRQSIQFGMRIDPETLVDVRRVVPDFTGASPERVRDEFFKMLDLPRPSAACRVADALGILELIVPEIEGSHGQPLNNPQTVDGWQHTLSVMESLSNILAVIAYTRTDSTAAGFTMGMMAIQLDRYRRQLQTHIDTVWPNERSHRALLMLAALLHNVGRSLEGQQETDDKSREAEMAEVRVSALRLSNAERVRLVTIIRHHKVPFHMGDLTPRVIHRFWRGLGEVGIDVCLFAMADYLGTHGSQIDQRGWLEFVDRIRILLEAYFDHYDRLVAPPNLVDGNYLIKTFGLRPGPVIGQLLDLIREAQVAGEIHTLDDALQIARVHLDQNT